MRIFAPAFTAPILCLALAACGGNASLNPTTWFSSSGPKKVALIPLGGFDQDEQLDQRVLVDQVTKFDTQQSPGGLILRATGLPPRIGYWDASLYALNDGAPVDGVISYEFRLSEPQHHTQSGRPQQREIYVGRFLSNETLREVKSIRIIGANNSRTIRR